MSGMELLNLAYAKQNARFFGLSKNPNIQIGDAYTQELEELFLVHHPGLKLNPAQAKTQFAEFLELRRKKKPLREQGIWVYFAWNNTLVHILNEKEFFELRTSRNHNLITTEEQDKLRTLRIGIAGLSVGNSAALALALESFETMRLADFDELSLSNLNRIRGSITQLGINKAIITARQIYELNPYAKLGLFAHGLRDKKSLKEFIEGPPRLDILIDEVDDVIIKVELRKVARRLRIPVVSAADNGTGVIADVERFDLEPKRNLYHGLLGDIEKQDLRNMSFAEKIKLINKMVGEEYVASRMKHSVLEVGNTLYSWPQLGGAAMLSGSTLVYLVKQVALGEKLESGKYDINLDRIFK